MKIGYVYALKQSHINDYKNLISRYTDRIYVDLISRKRLSMILSQATAGDELIIESLTQLGDSWTEIYQVITKWIEQKRHIYVIDERLIIKKDKDIQNVKTLAKTENQMVESRLYKFDAHSMQIKRIGTRRGKLSNSQIDQAIRMRQNNVSWTGKPPTMELLSRRFGVTRKTLSKSIAERLRFNRQVTHLFTPKLPD